MASCRREVGIGNYIYTDVRSLWINMIRYRLAAAVIVTTVVLWMTAPPGLADGGWWWWWWQHCLPARKIRVMLACSAIEFVPRSAWGARPPKGWDKLKVQPVPRMFVHHTEGPECFDYLSCSERMRHWQNFHMDTRDWFDLGYSFLIGGDGKVYVARGWDASGAHTKGNNEDALAVSFIGDFSRHLPTPRAIEALTRLLQCGVALGKIRADYTVHGHRDANCRACPGDALYAYISRWRRFGGRVKNYVCETPGRTEPSVTP